MCAGQCACAQSTESTSLGCDSWSLLITGNTKYPGPISEKILVTCQGSRSGSNSRFLPPDMESENQCVLTCCCWKRGNISSFLLQHKVQMTAQKMFLESDIRMEREDDWILNFENKFWQGAKTISVPLFPVTKMLISCQGC